MSARTRWPLQLAVFLASTVCFAWVGVRDAFNGLLSDSYVYLAAATALREHSGLLAHIVASYPFPPLFPALLALVGAGSDAPARTFVIGALLLAGVVVACLRWLLREGVPPGAALLAALAFALLPASLQTAMGVLSEPLYMLCVFGAMLTLPTRATPPRRLVVACWAAAFFVAAASLTRSVGVAAIAAFVVHWGFARGWRVARLAPLLAVLPFVAWEAWKRFGQQDAYALDVLDERDPLRMALLNLDAWRLYAVKGVDMSMSTVGTRLLAALGVLAALVWLPRLLRGRFDAWYVAAYLAVMAAWPHPHHAARFLYVLWPLAIGYCAWGVSALLSRLAAPVLLARMLPAVPSVLVLSLAVPGTTTILTQLWRARGDPVAVDMRAPSWYQSRAVAAQRSAAFSARLVAFQRRALAQIPADACVASIIPQQVLVYGPRRGVDLTQLQARGRTLDEVLAACPYVLMIAARPYPPLGGIGSLHPFEQIRERMEVIDFERERPDDPASPLLAMLSKVR